MQLKETQEALRAFGKYVVQQAKTNLTKGKHNVSKNLYDSLTFDIEKVAKGYQLFFEMDDYGMYQDRGVKGVKGGTSLANFSYKKTSNVIGFEYATGTFAKWAKFRGLQFRDKKGRFMSFKQTGILMAIGKKNKGIKPTLFFTKPFEAGLKRLPPDLENALRNDIENGF